MEQVRLISYIYILLDRVDKARGQKILNATTCGHANNNNLLEDSLYLSKSRDTPKSKDIQQLNNHY